MALTEEQFHEIQEILSDRRFRAEKTALEKEKEVLAKVEGYAALEEELRRTSVEAMEKAVGGDATAVQELRTAIRRIREKKEERTEEKKESLLLQAVGTSIDALSLGFTFSHDPTPEVFVSTLIIGVVTFSLSYIALFVGKKFGTIYAGKADVVGGVVLALVAIFL